MAFDPRSLERLRELGRSLPQPLPSPSSRDAASAASSPAPASQRRHRLETEEDPEQLFRELMAASPDGTVPPHLLDRLRQLETQRRPLDRLHHDQLHQDQRSSDRRSSDQSRSDRRTGRRRRDRPSPDPQNNRRQEDLYTAFAQLLLEEDDDS